MTVVRGKALVQASKKSFTTWTCDTEQLLGMPVPKLPPSATGKPKDGVNGGDMRPRCSLKSNAPARALAERRTGKIERRDSDGSISRPQAGSCTNRKLRFRSTPGCQASAGDSERAGRCPSLVTNCHLQAQGLYKIKMNCLVGTVCIRCQRGLKPERRPQ